MDHGGTDPTVEIERIIMDASRTLAAAAGVLAASTAEAATVVTEALRAGSKVLLCGNGGSAADAQHIAAELAGRLRLERRGLAALALTTNPSVVTALANDYGFEQVFSRQVEGIARAGDVLIGISTSCSSPNVVAALAAARSLGVRTIGLMGKAGGRMKEHCDIAVLVPSSDTQRIQETHIVVGHAICELVERALFGPQRA